MKQVPGCTEAKAVWLPGTGGPWKDVFGGKVWQAGTRLDLNAADAIVLIKA